jgi:DNA-binding winged helix-turn-helix (wHTH) protein
VIFEPDTSTLGLGDNVDGNTVMLSGVAKRILLLFIENYGEVISRKFIFKQVWDDYGMVASNNNLNQNISKLRRTLKELGINDEFITTVPKVGFVLKKNIKLEVLDPAQEDQGYIAITSLHEHDRVTLSSQDQDIASLPAVNPLIPVYSEKLTLKQNVILIWQMKKRLCLFALIALLIMGIGSIYFLRGEENTITPEEGFLGEVNSCKVFFVAGRNPSGERSPRLDRDMLAYVEDKNMSCSGDEYILIKNDDLVQTYIPGVKRRFLLKCKVLREHRIEMCSGSF